MAAGDKSTQQISDTFDEIIFINPDTGRLEDGLGVQLGATFHSDGNITAHQDIVVTGEITATNLAISNWNQAFNDYITGISGSGNGIVTLTQRDGGTITGDLSHSHSFEDIPITSTDTTNWDTAYNDHIVGVTGNGNGVLTLTQQDAGTITTDLTHAHAEADITDLGPYDNYVSFTASVDSDTEDTILSGDTLNFISGDSITLSQTGSDITIAFDGATAVTSVFTRTGDVVAQSGDYSFDLISGSVADNQMPTSYNNTNWDTAYGWGDHSTQGYYSSGDTPDFNAIDFTNHEKADYSVDGRLYWDLSAGLYIQSSNAGHANPALCWTSANFTAGGGISVSYDSEDEPTVSHSNTSSQGDINTSGGTVIDSITIDTYGHVTNMGTRSLDGRYLLDSGTRTFLGELTVEGTASGTHNPLIVQTDGPSGGIGIGRTFVVGSLSCPSVDGHFFTNADINDVVLRQDNSFRRVLAGAGSDRGVEFGDDGAMWASSYGSLSDAITKSDEEPMGEVLDKLMNIPAYKYAKGESKRIEFGRYAQDVQLKFPEVISETGDGKLAVDLGSLITINSKGIQELYDIINAQQEEIEELKST